MLGAIAGDVIGSIYEARPIKSKTFPLFGPDCVPTDDSVCTVAVADALVGDRNFAAALRAWVRRYPNAGYGASFRQWALTEHAGPHGGWGNGSAMRVSPVAYAANSLEDAMVLARAQAGVSHDHPDALDGAQAVAKAIWMARRGESVRAIKQAVSERFFYDLDLTVDVVRPGFGFDVSCRGTVPPALICAFEARDFEDAVRNAISLGGDADTLAAMAGSVAEALHGVPEAIEKEVRSRLPLDLASVLDRFREVYPAS